MRLYQNHPTQTQQISAWHGAPIYCLSWKAPIVQTNRWTTGHVFFWKGTAPLPKSPEERESRNPLEVSFFFLSLSCQGLAWRDKSPNYSSDNSVGSVSATLLGLPRWNSWPPVVFRFCNILCMDRIYFAPIRIAKNKLDNYSETACGPLTWNLPEKSSLWKEHRLPGDSSLNFPCGREGGLILPSPDGNNPLEDHQTLKWGKPNLESPGPQELPLET